MMYSCPYTSIARHRNFEFATPNFTCHSWYRECLYNNAINIRARRTYYCGFLQWP
jgi:hypothetical protein